MAKKINETQANANNDKIIELLEQIRELLEQLLEKDNKTNTWRL